MKAVPGRWLDRLMSEGFPPRIRLGNHDWTRDYSPSTSIHYVSEGGWRLRVSDHWCGPFPEGKDSPKHVNRIGRRKILLEAGGRFPYRNGLAGAIGRFER